MNGIFVIPCLLGLYILLWGYATIAGWRKSWFTVMNKRKTAVLPTLVVGNITVGGTGKTPFILFLASLFSDHKIAVLSRGYGRKTTGFREVWDSSKATQVGDEPLEIKRSLSENGLEVPVYVGENRLSAVEKISEMGQKDIIVLDDGLQHLPLKPDVSLVLTTCEKPFNKEKFALPFGKLREFKSRMNEYDLLVVTKCPSLFPQSEIEKWWEENKAGIGIDRKNVFFSTYKIVGPQWFSVSNRKDKIIESGRNEEFVAKDSLEKEKCLLITGVVKASGIQEFLDEQGFKLNKHFEYSDHYFFGEKELQEWIKFSQQNGVFYWFTTRKDWQRMRDLIEKSIEIIPAVVSLNIGVLHTEVTILENRKPELKERILNKIKELNT